MLFTPAFKKYLLVISTVLLGNVAPVQAALETLPCGVTVEPCFSYTHTCSAMVVQFIQSAKRRIFLAGYAFTSREITRALEDAHLRGVQVHLVLDKSNELSRVSTAPQLIAHGIDVRINHRYAIMHHKFIVADDAVGFGSMNFTYAGNQRNAENFTIFRHAPSLTTHYATEFVRLYQEALPYVSRIEPHKKRSSFLP